MDQRLVHAAQSGSIDALYDLIHEDPYVFENIDAIPFVNTPLHVAAASGTTAFAMEMMNLKPSFARKLNTYGFSPMHLALENGQARLALELLKVDPCLTRVRGREGMTPLHLLVKKGDNSLLSEFLLACPECIRDVNVNGETALHIAVMNDRYEELQVLTGWVQRMSQKDSASLEVQILNRREKDGNTALHLAAYQDNRQAIRLLIGCPSVNRNIPNGNGLTALDILQIPRQQHMNGDVQKIIRKSGGKNAASLPKVKTTPEFLRSPITFSEYLSTYLARYRNNISEGTRSALLVIATLIITATYQTALQPPGGVHQDNGGNNNATTAGGTNSGRESRDAGTVVMNENYFQALWTLNGASFWTAMFTTFLVLPVGKDYVQLFFSMAVPLYFSYAVSMSIVSPGSIGYLLSASLAFVIYILGYYMMFFLQWKQSILKKIPEPRSELILEGLTTLNLARGMEEG